MKITDEAVNAALNAWVSESTPNSDMVEDMRASLTAALPHLQAGVDVTSLDLSILEKLSEKADEFDIPDDFGPWPDIQDAMITAGDLRKVRKFLQDFRKVRKFLQDFRNMPFRTLKGQHHDELVTRQNAEEVIKNLKNNISAKDKLIQSLIDFDSEEVKRLEADNKQLREEIAAVRKQALEEILRELSGNPRQLIDMMASAIRADGSDLCDAPWESLSDDRKLAWRGDAERALAAVKYYLTTRAALSDAPTTEAQS